MKSFKILILILFLQLAYSVKAQHGLVFNYSVDEGLPSSEVYYVTQDVHGYIWILTDKGLSRFDGYQFENFSKKDGLTDNVFFDAYQVDESIWFLGQNNTITIIEGKEPLITPYEFNDTLQKYGLLIPSEFYVDEEKSLYVGYLTSTGYLEISNRGELNNRAIRNYMADSISLVFPIKQSDFYYQEAEIQEYESNNISDRFLRDDGHYTARAALLESSGAWVFKIERGKLQVSMMNGESHYIDSLKNVDKVGPLDQDEFWVTFTFGGVKILNINGKEVAHLFPDHSMSNVFIDNEGNQWFSSLDAGVFVIPHGNVKQFDLQSESDNSIHDLSIGLDDRLVVGHMNGNVSVLYGNEMRTVYTAKSSKPSSLLHKLNKTYFMSDTRMFLLDSMKMLDVLLFGNPNELVLLENGHMAVCCYAGYFEIDNNIKKKMGILPNKVYDACTYDNKVYIASYSGLYHLNDDSTEFIKSEIIDGRVNQIEAIDNYLLVGTNGMGLKIFKGNEALLTLGKEEIGGEFINKIKITGPTTIWVATNRGLARIEYAKVGEEISFVLEDLSDRLPSKEVVDVELIRDTLWIGSTNGLYYLDMIQYESRKDKFDHHLSIVDVSVNDRLVELDYLESLDYTENRIVFNFNAISLDPTTKLVYRYKLENSETIWNYTGGRSAIYSNLSPGDYEFVVQLKGEHEDWSENQRIPFSIAPPFWTTGWFYLILFLSIGLVVYLFFRFRILLYNRDLVRDILRHLVRRIKTDEPYIVVREGNINVKIYSNTIHFVKSDGNYLEIHHDSGKTLTRFKIGEFMELVPDPLEYIRIRRSFIVRIDKIEKLGKKEVVVNGETIPVGKTYLEELKKINF